MNLRYPEGLRSTLNAELTLTGTLEAPRLSGNVDVLRATYRTPLDPGAGLLGYLSAASGQLGADSGLPSAPPAPTGFPLVFDVRVVANRLPEPIIHLPDATIWVSADLLFSGTVDRPQLVGGVTIDQGELFFSGNRYIVQRGVVDFLGGGTGFEPYFDVELVTRVRIPGQTYQVDLRVTGTQDSFVPTLTSDPPLSSDMDILGLMFGELPDLGQVEQRSLQSPQQAQAMLLRTAAAQVLASPITSKVQGVVQQAVPIDTIAITPLLGDEATLQQLNPTARITLGKRISPRVFLTYSRALNTSAEYEVILLEYDQNDRLSWVLSRNEDRTFALDFRIRYVF
jgi:translocation and assembly module TamB